MPNNTHIIIANAVFKNCKDTALRLDTTFQQASNITFVNCTFENNTGINGGAISVSKTTTHTEKQQQNSDGMRTTYFESLHMSFISCTFRNNSASKAGGAVYLEDTIVDYDADKHDALKYRFPTLFHNCTFDSNNGTEAGGAVYAVGREPDWTYAMGRDEVVR